MENTSYLSFGGDEVSPIDFETANIVVLPLYYENAVSYGTGAKDGPFHILKASAQLESIDEETQINWGQFKIYTEQPVVPSMNAEQAVMEMKAAAERIVHRRKFLLSLGGDHAISIGPVMAASEQYPGIGVLQIDAHLDLRNEWNGSRYNHACVMRRIADDLNLPIVQVGIRSFSSEEAEYVTCRQLKPFYAHQIEPFDDGWIEQVVNALPETVYLTFDLDGLDPSVLPGTGTPEPGGLSYRQALRLIKAVGRRRNVIAADINELAKIPGTQVSEYTAAKIAAKLFTSCARPSSG